MRLATWNVNSIRARLPRVLEWLAQRSPDVVCLQETKVDDDKLPRAELEGLGYHVAHAGQRTYNGVALLSRLPLEDVDRGGALTAPDAEPQQRLIAATIGGVRVVSIYVPNGQAVGTRKFDYKLEWLRRFRGWLEATCSPGAPLAVCGDFNVAPEERDVHDPAGWAGTTLFHPDARRGLAEVASWGLEDVLRRHHEEAGIYSWWDYRMLCFPRNRGLRIDHVFATRSLAERSTACFVDREARKGKNPSDHAPVIAEFA
jgi:exodeoxyribonuclease III